eukprot:527055_1
MLKKKRMSCKRPIIQKDLSGNNTHEDYWSLNGIEHDLKREMALLWRREMEHYFGVAKQNEQMDQGCLTMTVQRHRIKLKATTVETYYQDRPKFRASHPVGRKVVPDPPNKSKSNRIYKHRGTLASASTEEETPTSTVITEMSALSVDNAKEEIQQVYAPNRQTIPTDLKMVIIVRKDLMMSSGEAAVQCCHGCFGVVMDIINQEHINAKYDLRLILGLWRQNGEKKIVLQCADEAQLMHLK